MFQRNTDATDVPAFSCRSGLSVPLTVTGSSGPELQPFQIEMKKKIDEAEGSLIHVVTMNRRTLKQVGVEARCQRTF